MNNNKIRKNSVLLLFLAWVIFSSLNPAHARPTLNAAASKAELEAALKGPGINITGGSLTEVAGANGYGTFSGGKVSDGAGPVLGIEQGIFLSTTNASTNPEYVIGPNNSDSISGYLNTTFSDPQLTAVVSNAIYDPVILSLQATPQYNNLNFEFAFGSDEYPEYVCSEFNDAFGFFIKPRGSAESEWKNVAIVPNTKQPIAVNTINSGACGSEEDSIGKPNSILSNSAFYIANGDGNTPTANSNLQYDGFTTLLSVSTKVIPNQVYDIKLAIADAGDGSYDSGIFLKWLSSTAEVDLDVSLTADNTSPKATVDNVTFTLTANNTGPDAARDVKVAFQLPTGFTWVSDTSNGSYDKQTGIWSLATTLSASTGTASINIVAKPTIGSVGSVKAFAQVKSVTATSDSDSTPNNGNQTPDEDDEAHLSLNVQAPPTVTYTCPTSTGFSSYATSGTGPFRKSIHWLTWDCDGRTFTQYNEYKKSWQLPNNTIINATIKNIRNGNVASYNSGDWLGDTFDENYVDVNPVGLVNHVDMSQPKFDIDFSMTINGVTKPVDIVTADAEDTGNGERYEWVTNGNPWQVIGFATSQYYSTVRFDTKFSNNGKTLELLGNSNGYAGSVLALSRNISTINVDVKQAGHEALAFGVFLPFDHGDAPSKYGTPTHYIRKTATGGSQTSGTFAASALPLATLGLEKTIFLGTQAPDAEGQPEYSSDASADNAQDDGVLISGSSLQNATLIPQSTQVLTINTTGSGYLNAWFDWNGDGDFEDAGEQIADNVAPQGNKIYLTLTTPIDATAGTSFARFRFSSQKDLTPTNVATDGEVEDYKVTIDALTIASSSASCPEYIPSNSPTTALTAAQVSWDITGAGGTETAILNSFSVTGEPRPFTDIIMADRVAYQFKNPKSSSQFLQKQQASTGKHILTNDFSTALLAANSDRDITHYLSLDNTIYPSDFVDFYYDTPITSAGNRYILVSERNGNNAMGVEALNSSNQVIGNQASITPNVTNIDSGVPLMYGQHAYFTIYPLTAIAPAGTKIHGIRLTHTGSPATGGDGGDGKVFIMVDPVTYTTPPQLQAPTVNAASCSTPTASIAVNAISNGNNALEYSIDGTNYQDSKTFSNLSAGTYHVKTRYKGYASCSATYISNPVKLTDPTDCDPQTPPLPTDNCAVNYYGWNMSFTGGTLDQDHAGTAFADSGWEFNSNQLPVRYNTSDSTGSLSSGELLPELDTSTGSTTGETFLTITRIERKPNTDTFVDMYDAKNLEHYVYAVLDSDGKLLTRSPATGEYMSASQSQRISFRAPSNGIAYVYTWIADFDSKKYTPYALCQDHGDAPNSFTDSTHMVGKDLYLGSKPADAELEANFSSDAQGDGSEDDGLKLPAFILGQASEAVVKVSGTGGYLQAWADWNGNGVFDSAEQIAHNLQDSDADGKIKLSFTVPANATTNTSYLRLRWSTQNNLDATANAKDGEVEDFVIQPVSANAFSCSSDIYQYGDNSFRRYNPNNRQYEVISNLHDVSIAYSTKNNLIYGIYKDGSGKVVVIEPNGAEKFVGIVHKEDGSVLSDTPIAMAIDANGDAWVRNGNMPATQYYKINLKSLTASEVTLSTTLSAPSPNISDLAYLANGNTNKLYARRDNTLYIIDAKALTLSAKTVTGEGTLGGYGAVWADSNQYVYTYNRSNGHLYQISDLSAATPKSKLIIVTDQISSNGAASCSLAPAPFFDLGDAPSQYKKAIHSVDGALSFLGQTIPDVDTSSLASSNALGDDTTGDDEDGTTFPSLSTSNATYSTSVIATNKNTVDATLIGWIDLDGNGVFDADEAAKVTVPAGSNKTSFTLTWDGLNDTGANTVAGNTYARLRLSTDTTLTTTTPDGLVAGGEVEDYALSITSPPAKQVAACTGAWTKNGANYQSTLSNGIKVTASTSIASGGAWSFSPNGNLNTHDAFSDAAVKGNSSLQFVYTWDTTPEDSVASATDIAAGQLSFSFSRPVFDPIMHIDRVGGFGNNIPNSALLTLNTANTSLSKLSGFSHLLVNSNTIQRELSSTTLQAGATSESGSDPLLYTAAGSVKIKGNKLNQISFDMSAVGVEGAGADGIEVVLCVDNELDFGDAPSGYGEASHYIEAPNMPYLGNTKPDFETTAAHNMTASGDNSQGNNDEDAVSTLSESKTKSPTSSLINLSTASSRFSLDVMVNNPHTTDAYLAAWIDFDGNGTFDADELKQVTVPAGTQNATLTVTWNKLPSDIKAGASFLRLRITTDPDFANNPSATAIASDGESEDYALTINAGTQTVSGRLFTDSDVDGLYDAGERGMKKVLVALMGRANDGQGVCIGTLSKADGSFSFKDIKPGNYQVYETGTPSSTCDSSLAGTPDGFIATTVMLQTISVSNTAVTDVNFGQVYDASHQSSGEFTSFRKDEQSRITAGEKALYAHTFIAPSKGSVNFSAQLQGNNWAYLLHHDANCDRKLSSSEYQTTLTPIAVNAQDQVCVVATVGSPIRAVTGEQGVLTITADFTYANTLSATTKTATVTDITTIQQGTEKQGAPLSNNDQRRLVLTKTVRNITAGTPASETLNQAAPGDVLEYRIHYYNQTAKDIDHLNIDDGIPEFTSLVNGSMTCQTDKPSSLSCHEVMQGDFLQWQFSGVLKSGHKGSVSFRVSID